MTATVRRVVLGTDPDGHSLVVEDGPPPTVHVAASLPGYALTEVWSTDVVPAPVAGADPTVRRVSSRPGPSAAPGPSAGPSPSAAPSPSAGPDASPPPGGTRFWLVDFPPGGVLPPVMHATPTIDYVAVLSGSVSLDLEDGSILLRAGDVAVQRANRHAWRNDGDEPCRLAVVMLGTGG